MANVDVVNLNGEKVGSLELADAVFAPEQVNEALLWEAVKHYRASLRQGTHKTKNRSWLPVPARSCGSRRARAARVSVRCARPVAPWLHGARTAAAQLRLCVPAQEAAGRAALGAGFEAGRRQADGGGFAGDQGRQDQALSRGAGQAGRDAHGAAGRERQDAFAGADAGRAQPEGRGAGAEQRSASLRSAALRAGDLFEGRHRAVDGGAGEVRFEAQALAQKEAA